MRLNPHALTPLRRRTRRWRTALACGLIPIMAAACSGATGAAGPVGPPKPGGSLTVAIDTGITGLDPNVAASAQEARVLRQLYDSLVATTPDGTKQVPWLASAWTISPDGKTYTFTLRDGVTFHDGTPFDAGAVCFNLDRIADPSTGSVFAIGAIGPYKSCAATAPNTAVVTLSAPYAPFLANLSSPFLGMVSPTAVRAEGAQAFRLKPVGTGPYKFVSYTTNDRIVLARNDSYAWGPAGAGHSGPAYLDTLTFQIIPDATVRMGSLRSGAVQMVGNVPETQVSAVQNDSTLHFYKQNQSGSPFQLHFNTAKAPWGDPALRRAIRSGFDVASAVKSLYFGVYDRAWSPLSPSTSGYDRTVENSWQFNANAARSALDALGWVPGADGIRQRDGQRLSITYLEASPNREKRQDIAEFFKQNMKDIGVEVTVKLVQTAPLQAAIQAGDYDIVGLSLVNIDPNVLYSVYSSKFVPKPQALGFNMARVSDPALDGELLAAQQDLDRTSRMAKYSALQKEITQDAFSIPVYVPTYTAATGAGVAGLRFDAEGYPIFYDTYLAS
ncbi:ABC transporter substrate-binding protein [Amycolatopsis alkalitolerans]|nr:ABC transporter substrate-binding protein [Amycolatopsis alkalitolerans]